MVRNGEELTAAPAEGPVEEGGPDRWRRLDWPCPKAQPRKVQSELFPCSLGSLAAVGSVWCFHLAPMCPSALQ